MLYTCAHMKLNGQPLSIKNAYIDKFIQFLESLPDDEVLTAQELNAKNIVNRTTLRYWSKNNPKLTFYSYLVPNCGGFYVYGNHRAILATRKQTEKTMGGK